MKKKTASKSKSPLIKQKPPKSKAVSPSVESVAAHSVFKFSHHTLALGTKPDGTIARFVSVGELVFNDPASRNSFRVETAREFAKFLPQIEKTCDALVFRAEGRVFCSGGNLKDHHVQGAAKGKDANRTIAQILTKLSSLKIPTVAVVDGDVLGGGAELLSAFDVVLAAPHVLFGFWQRRLGLAAGWGGGARLARRIGPAKVARLFLEARAMTAEEACDHGLIDGVFSRWSLRHEAMAEALRLASLPRASVTAMKSLREIPSTEAAREQHGFEKLWYGETHREYLHLRRDSRYRK